VAFYVVVVIVGKEQQQFLVKISLYGKQGKQKKGR